MNSYLKLFLTIIFSTISAAIFVSIINLLLQKDPGDEFYIFRLLQFFPVGFIASTLVFWPILSLNRKFALKRIGSVMVASLAIIISALPKFETFLSTTFGYLNGLENSPNLFSVLSAFTLSYQLALFAIFLVIFFSSSFLVNNFLSKNIKH